MADEHGAPADERGCARRRCRPALQEHRGATAAAAAPTRPKGRVPGRSRGAAATLLVLSLGLGAAAAAAAAASSNSAAAASGGSNSWWSWAQSALTGSRRQADDATAGGEDGEEGDAAQNETAVPVVPYISGIWRMTYEYAEMTGPRANLETNPCYGPFPYRYTWNVYIWQKVKAENGTRRTTGDIRVCVTDREDCQSDSKAWTIIQSNRDIVDSKCRFAPYDEHPSDWYRFPGYQRGGYQKQLVPTDKDGKELPVRTYDAFKTPNVEPWVWGIFCQQFSWYDDKTDVKNTPMPLYEGTWRHDNETWVILREISTCPCFPACMNCEETIPGTTLKQVIESDGGACLAEWNVVPADCDYVIRGVSGGPVRYPTITTGKDKADNGEDDQVCFAYARLKGEKIKEPSLLPVIRERSWDGMGIPNDNVDPLKRR